MAKTISIESDMNANSMTAKRGLLVRIQHIVPVSSLELGSVKMLSYGTGHTLHAALATGMGCATEEVLSRVLNLF